MDFNSESGVTVDEHITVHHNQFTLSESMRLMGSKSTTPALEKKKKKTVRGHVEIWSRARLCFSVICVAERELPQTLI